MTFKELKEKITKSTITQKLPTFRELSLSTFKIIIQLETTESKLFVYENGFVSYSLIQDGRACSTVFTIDKMKWKYTFVKGNDLTIPESEYENFDAAKLLTLYAEERLMHNSDSREEYKTDYHLDSDGNDFTTEASTPDFTDAFLDNFEHRTTSNRLYKAISKLTEKQRIVLELYYFNQKTQQEIAAKLGISRTSVQDRLDGALKKLKKIF